MIWEPTREAGLARLAAFLPHAARDYAARRNLDLGPADRSNVSALSPWLRRRLVTEQEVVAAVLARHDLADADKFVAEVAWRTYWKGWLELRPAMLDRYEAERDDWQARIAGDSDLLARVQRATDGATGIACFDAWVDELRQLGWLHNHARMWFASIWIFTLRLPWQLGADFFARHLLDADPASNTLSWRWVAGLHTAGKHYLARAENIALNTQGRFAPYGQLDEAAEALREEEPVPPVTPTGPAPEAPQGPCALLLTGEDLHPESWALAGEVKAIAVLPGADDGLPDSPAARFSAGALADGAGRAAAHFGVACDVVAAHDLPRWLAGHGLAMLVTAQAPVGATARQLAGVETELARQGARLVQLRRTWDALLWPHATAGFFKLKSRLPAVIRELGLQS